MKILQYIRRVFSFLGYLSDERIFAFMFGHEIISVSFILILFIFEASSVVYAVRHLVIGDLQNFLHASYCIPALITAIGSFFTMMYHKDKISVVIGYFQKIFDKCNGIYWSTTLYMNLNCTNFNHRWKETNSHSLHSSRSNLWEIFEGSVDCGHGRIHRIFIHVCRNDLCVLLPPRCAHWVREDISAVQGQVECSTVASNGQNNNRFFFF